MWRAAAVAVVGTALILSACSTSAAEFSDDAERFLRSDEVFRTYGLDLPEPECAEPPSTETGTTFSCMATSQDDTTYEFTFVITGRNDLRLDAIEFADV
jgi:hypothetical protein